MRQRSPLPTRRTALAAAVAMVALMAGLSGTAGATRGTAGQEVGAPESYTALTLVNGWSGGTSNTRTPKVALVNGVVVFKGAMSTLGSDPTAFTLPPQMRPPKSVFVQVDLCNAANGRLLIQPNGVATVDPEGAFSDASCFTSLDGASFVLSTPGQVGLTLQNGWTGAPFGTHNPKAVLDAGIVHLRGAIASGSSPDLFTLPAGMRPSKDVFVPADLCNAANGRLHIQTDGVVQVQAEGGNFSAAQCFTSLDGVSFMVNPTSPTALTLQNGWTPDSGIRTPKAVVIAGIVHMRGAIEFGSSDAVFTLPAGMRPTQRVYVPIDLVSGHDGRLVIEPTGATTVDAQGNFSDAQNFSSLDGVAFAL